VITTASRQMDLTPARIEREIASSWTPDSEVDLLHLITTGLELAPTHARKQGFLVPWESPRITMLIWGAGERVWGAANDLLNLLLEQGIIHYQPVGMAIYPIDRPETGAVVLASKLSTFSREPAAALANLARKRGTNAKRE
jgi:hypothetical protein